MHPRSKVGRSHKLMPKSDPKDLCPPAKYKPRRDARPLSAAEIKAAADRAEARSKLTAQYSATKRLRILPRLSTSVSMTSPILRKLLVPWPTPPQVPQLKMSPGSSVRMLEAYSICSSGKDELRGVAVLLDLAIDGEADEQ